MVVAGGTSGVLLPNSAKQAPILNNAFLWAVASQPSEKHLPGFRPGGKARECLQLKEGLERVGKGPYSDHWYHWKSSPLLECGFLAMALCMSDPACTLTLACSLMAVCKPREGWDLATSLSLCSPPNVSGLAESKGNPRYSSEFEEILSGKTAIGVRGITQW